ncbi:MAG: hypothetical protein ACLQEQ_01055 [Nitrososphaerales archaeon]
MKFLIEFNPPVEVKNELDRSPAMQAKLGEAIQSMKPIAGWFTFRRGFFVVEANSMEELGKKAAPFFYMFKEDPIISPAFGLDEFAKLLSMFAGEAKKLQ